MNMVVPKTMDSEVREFLNKFDFSACLVCGTCSNGCPITGTPGMEGWNTRKVMRMLAYGMVDEVVESKFPWLCTGCGRCAYSCPMGIDIPAVMAHMKSMRDRDKVPGSLHKGTMNNVDSGNNLAIPKDDYLMGMADLGEEMSEECPGFYVPVDKQDADILFFPTPRKYMVTTKTSSGGGRSFTPPRKTGPFLPKDGRPWTGLCLPVTMKPTRFWPSVRSIT